MNYMESKAAIAKTEYLNIGIDVIAYDAKYSRSYGTVGQLVRSLQDMSRRVSEKESADIYHTELHSQIVQQCNELVEVYGKLVSAILPEEYSIFGYYLNGSQNNGKRRQIANKKEMKRYEFSRLTETLRSIDDRLRYIKYDCIRKKQDTQCSEPRTVLDNVILFSDTYHTEIRRQLTTWYDFVKEIREKHNFQQTPTNPLIKSEGYRDRKPKFLIRKKTYQTDENVATLQSS